MSAIVIKGPLPVSKLFNMNTPPKSRGAGIRRSEEIAEWRKSVYYCGLEVIRKNKHLLPLGPCYVQVSLGVPNNIIRDPHNYEPNTKCAVDSLTKELGLWPDDNPKWVSVLPTTLHRGGDYIITITPRENP